MTHTEVFDSIMKAHGSNYKQYSFSKGKAKNYAQRLFNSNSLVMMSDKFYECMSDFGAKIYADNGRVRVDMDGVMSGLDNIPLWSVLSVMHTLGYTMIVTDKIGDKAVEYIVDTGVVDTEKKIDRRRKATAE